MKTIFTKIFLLSLGFMLINTLCNAQNGLDTVIVEKYYISNADDSIGSVGILPVGSVTYRIFVGMRPGYNFQMAYGSSSHPLTINTTTFFFNNEDRGATNPTYTKSQAKNNTVMLDSWLSVGAACAGNYGILKSKDNGVATIVNANGILQNADTSAGIPLTAQDGLIAGNPGSINFVGINDSTIAVFDVTSQLGNSFTLTNGAWSCLSHATGPDTNNNQVLIAQITTNGQLSFKLNLQIGTPSGDYELYVADSVPGDSLNNPKEIQRGFLTYISDTIHIAPNKVNDLEKNYTFSVSPNPSKGIFELNINAKSQNSENYYTISNILGNILFKKKINTSPDNYRETVDLTSFKNGIYFIEVSINGIRTTHKLIKN